MPALHPNPIVAQFQKIYRWLRYGYWEPTTLKKDWALEDFLKGQRPLKLIQIGANDGQVNDKVFPLLKKWPIEKAVLVEPLPAPFKKLEALHARSENVYLENKAVAQSNSSTAIYTIPPENQDESKGFSDRISSFSREHLNKFEEFFPGVSERVVEQEIATTSFQSLCEKHGINHLDLLYIDTEGFDYEILKLIDFSALTIAVIHYEWAHLPMEDYKRSLNLLRSHHYKLYQQDRDLIALQKKPQIKAKVGK